jgi:Na+/H+ antiporter NhaD/arsenite permease-like protein
VLTGATIFIVTYVLIAGRRLRFMPLDRPAGALVGAVLVVALRVLTPAQALGAIDGRTLLLLFGLMGMGTFLAEGGLLDRASRSIIAWARTPARLLGALIWGAGALSALVTNDAVCVLGAPLVVAWVRRHKLPPLPFLLALATASNTGSVATLVGNPQNMLCGALGGLVYREYLVHMVPVALAGLAVNHVFLAFLFRRQLRDARLDLDAVAPAPSGEPGGPEGSGGPARTPLLDRRSRFTVGVLVAVFCAYLVGANLAWTAVAGFTALLVVHRADPTTFWGRIDWSVLLFFGGLFVVVEGLVASGAAAWALARVPIWTGAAGGGLASYARTASIFLVGSNVVSNVPFILVVKGEMARLPDPRLAWELLAMASTFGGNLTLLGSVANIIVAERGRVVGGLKFWPYLRVGLPLAVVTTAIGTVWLLLVSGALGG